MTLSEREQQILQDIERRLYEQDPKFAREVASSTLQTHLVRHIRRGVLLFVAGFGFLIAFFFHPWIPIGVAAFGVMLLAAVYIFQNLKKAGTERMRVLKEQAPLSNFFKDFQERLKQMRNRPEQ